MSLISSPELPPRSKNLISIAKENWGTAFSSIFFPTGFSSLPVRGSHSRYKSPGKNKGERETIISSWKFLATQGLSEDRRSFYSMKKKAQLLMNILQINRIQHTWKEQRPPQKGFIPGLNRSWRLRKILLSITMKILSFHFSWYRNDIWKIPTLCLIKEKHFYEIGAVNYFLTGWEEHMGDHMLHPTWRRG